jgi:hypothetical protein
MATQYTGGQVTGQVLTAATMTSIGAAYETFTPNFRPQSGVWFVANQVSGKYGRIGKLVYGSAQLDIVSFGTAGSNVLFDLPITAKFGNPYSIGSGREANLTGNQFNVITSATTTGQIIFYNNAATANNNYNYSFFFIYEAA